MASHELLGVPVDAFSARNEAVEKALRNGKPVTYRVGNVVDTIYPKQAQAIWELRVAAPQRRITPPRR